MKQLKKISIKKIVLVIVFLVIGSFLIYLLRKPSPPTVISTTPAYNQEGVQLDSSITIVFSRELSDDEKKKTDIQVSPDAAFEQIWEQEKLRITPKETLKQANKYAVTVKYQNKIIYTFTFETILLTDEQLKIEGPKQTADDLLYGKAYNEFIKKYPWYQKLPIERKEYRIVYDFERKAFRIRILIGVESEEQETALINAALKDIETIGYKGVPSYYVVKN